MFEDLYKFLSTDQ